MRHYSEADLLETYYTAPGSSMPVMMHLASCPDCAARYERLESKLRKVSEPCSVEEKPATFWSRQRHLVLRGVEERQRNAMQLRRFSRIAAAAVISFVLGGTIVYESVTPEQHTSAPRPQATATAAPGALLSANHEKSDELLTRDPWQSEELSDFHKVVEWESWEPEGGVVKPGKGAL
jgi:predicted anti-sigma-YlaC factor YlaD